MTCAKQIVIATIQNNGESFVGENLCLTPQKDCPRSHMNTGEGYELCKDICNQKEHAEVAACMLAGEKANGGVMTISGHTYCCESCLDVIKKHGITEVYFI